MELVELCSDQSKYLIESAWASHVSPSIECCVVMAKEPFLVKLRPKPYAAHLNLTTGPFETIVLECESTTKKPEVMLPSTQAISLETVSQLLLHPSLLNAKLPWIHRNDVYSQNAAWSPSNDSFICAVLCDNGEVSFWDALNNTHILWMTDILSDLYFSTPISLSDSNLQELKSIYESLFVTSICWSNAMYEFEGETFTYFITAHKSGKINIWKIAFVRNWDFHLKFTLKHTILIEHKNVTQILWVSLNECEALIYGNSLGQLNSISFHLSKIHVFDNIIKFSISSDIDRINVSKILYVPGPNSTIYLIVIKMCYFIIYVLDLNFKTLYMKFVDLGNNNITGTKQVDENNFIISTFTGNMWHLSLLIDSENKLAINTQHVQSNINFDGWSLRGMYITKNTALCVLFLTPSKTIYVRKEKLTSKVVYGYFQNINCLKTLQINKTQELTEYWDVLELFRIYNSKLLEPSSNFSVDIYEGMTNYEIKMSLWINIIKCLGTKKELFADVFHSVLYNHVNNSISKYVDIFNSKNEINEFDLKTVTAYVNFFQNYNSTINVSTLDTKKDKLQVFDGKLPEIIKQCDYCGENFKSISCSQGHFHQWCCITLQEIENLNYLRCLICKTVAHCNLVSHNPKCIFCDIYLEKNAL